MSSGKIGPAIVQPPVITMAERMQAIGNDLKNVAKDIGLAYVGGILVAQSVAESLNRTLEEKAQKRERERRKKAQLVRNDAEDIRKECERLEQSINDVIKDSQEDQEYCKKLSDQLAKVQNITVQVFSDDLEDLESSIFVAREQLLTIKRDVRRLIDEQSIITKSVHNASKYENLKKLAEEMSNSISEAENITTENVHGLTVEEYRQKYLKNIIPEIEVAKQKELSRRERIPLSKVNKSHLSGLFEEMDVALTKLSDPHVPFGEKQFAFHILKKDIHSYEELELQLDEIESEFETLYTSYVILQEQLEHDVRGKMDFSGIEDLRKETQQLTKTFEHLYECAEIYRLLGQDGYIAYAFNKEMLKIEQEEDDGEEEEEKGYSIVSRKQFEEFSEKIGEYIQPKLHATKFIINGEEEEIKLQMYDYGEDKLTQVYKINADQDCNMRLIIHENGTVTMQTFSENGDRGCGDKIPELQRKRIQKLKEQLSKNWFINYNFQEDDDPEKIWRNANISNDESETKQNYDEETEKVSKYMHQTIKE